MYPNGDGRSRLYDNDRYPLKLIHEDGGVWVFKPKTPRNGIVLYAKVQSLRDGRKVYNVKKERIGAYQFNYSCSCLGNFLGHYLCVHIARFKLVEAATRELR